MRRDSSSPQAYRNAVESPLREILEAVRARILEAVPEVEESTEYGMLDYPGVANLAAQKNYVALYVAPVVLARHLKYFPGIDAGKSCLRFRKLAQVDEAAVTRLLREVVEFRKSQPSTGG